MTRRAHAWPPGKVAPPRVTDGEAYWVDPPPVASDRCVYWVVRIQDGWRPNRFIGRLGYYSAAEYYGVYIWEYLHVISVLLR